ncbi:MAG: hypothetical protein GXO88_11780 [Chlorobi bacterium]|nr:hypothetical protein [Chlorobiota bacterium]
MNSKDKEIAGQIAKLDILINEKANIDLLYKRADLYLKTGENGKAINDYYKILKLDENQEFAKTKIEFLKTILRYNNTDIYASPNTNFDPWLE